VLIHIRNGKHGSMKGSIEMNDKGNLNIVKYLLSFVLLLIIIPSCRREQAMIPNEPPTDTAIPQASPTTRPTRTAISGFPFQEMTIAPSEIKTPTPTEPPIDADPSLYTLVTPDPSFLLSMIEDINQYYQTAGQEYPDLDDSDAAQDEADAFTKHINFELMRNYPEGLPNPSIALEVPPWRTSGLLVLFPEIFPQLVEDAIVSYLNIDHPLLNDGQTISGPGFEADVHLVEIDGDADPEWYLKVMSTDSNSIQWILIDGENDTYRQLSSKPLFLYGVWTINSNFELIALTDLTGDGLTDVVMLYTTFLLERLTMDFHILQGSKDGFMGLSTINRLVRMQSDQFVDYESTIGENAATTTLKLIEDNDLHWGCTWTSVTTYNWANGVEHITMTNEDPPDTPECLLAQVFNEFSVTPVEHIPLLERALVGFANAGLANSDLAQLARYRLGLLYALQGQNDKAKGHLLTFLDIYASGDYEGSELEAYLETTMKPLLDVTTIDPFALCKVTYNHPEKFTGWARYINLTALFPGNTFYSDLFPPALCPSVELVLQMLERVPFDPSTSPKDSLLSAHIPALVALSYPLQNDPTPAWYVYVNSDHNVIYGYLPDNGNFHWEVVHMAQEPLSYNVAGEPSWYKGDITGDGQPEIAFLIPQVSGDCEEGKSNYEVFVITNIGGGKDFSSSKYFCLSDDDLKNPSTFLQDRDEDGLVDWIMEIVMNISWDLPGLFDKLGSKELITESDLWDAKYEMEEETEEEGEVEERNFNEALFNGEDPAQIRLELKEAIQNLSDESPIYDLKYQHYTYLMALSYELEGNIDEALITFHRLARSEVQTFWRDMAIARLKHK
jgi:hypothetical protein